MTWNYRIFKHKGTDGHDPVPTYALHEVYYDEEGKTRGWTLEPMAGHHHESVEELLAELAQMLNDATKAKDAVLDFDTNPQNPFENDAPNSL